MPKIPLRWVVISVALLASTLNYLDRQLLAAVAPSLRTEFHLSNQEYGQIVSAFSIVYAFIAPLAGLFIDRVGLNAGVSIAVLVWSLAGAATGFTHTVRQLVASRTMLGIAESAGIPCFGKANALYLEPSELAHRHGSQSSGHQYRFDDGAAHRGGRRSIVRMAIHVHTVWRVRPGVGPDMAVHREACTRASRREARVRRELCANCCAIAGSGGWFRPQFS